MAESFQVTPTPPPPTQGSVLAKRMPYSNLTSMTSAQQTSAKESRSRYKDSPESASSSKHACLPQLVDPTSAFAKRCAYSSRPRGRTDTLSKEMRDYFTNKSLIKTWLMNRMIKKANETTSLAEDLASPPDSSPKKSPSSSHHIGEQGLSLGQKGRRDALSATTGIFLPCEPNSNLDEGEDV